MKSNTSAEEALLRHAEAHTKLLRHMEARCETFKQMSQLAQREHSKTTALLHTLYEEVAVHCAKAFTAGFAAGALLLWAMT